ncbi:glycosyltransferase family 4 protein [Arthrobacter sp. UCD-GKA]|uniref:glycosyltransferase family 4 protein n=1 Tax=Arthrobacter sp. UCD-GKA TaxID=1913576 RepID=UPI0009F6B883|nr:glycosyltransferase family 4 protein [Arthrobacter sp. UCD-GKA]
MKLGFLYPARDPLEPTNWSGTPAGLAGGFRENGAVVVPICAVIPPGLHQAVAILSRITGRRGAVADRLGVRQWARTRALSKSLAGAGELDAVVAMGTEMYDLASVLRGRFPAVTYDDGTFRQMVDHPDSDISQAGFPRKHVERWIRRQNDSCREAILCCTSTMWAADSIASDYGIPAARIAVVGMGHRPRTGISEHRDWARPRFLFVGVDWKRKNGDAVVHAFTRLHRTFPQATLDLVGEHPRIDVPGVIGHGMIPRNDLAGQKKLDDLYAASTAFVLPSRFDPSPISYLEAASAGLPVVATAVGGAGELLGNGAITVDPLKRDEIYAAMFRLCDPEVAQLMGAQAKLASESSRWTDVAGRILAGLAARGIGLPSDDPKKPMFPETGAQRR